MKAYCINLDRRPDRLEYISCEFSRINIPFERVPAVDAQNPEVAAAAARMPPMPLGHQMGAGAYGCFQSHRKIWRRLIASGESHAMACEDDLVLDSGLARLMADDWVPEDADIVKMETFGSRVHLSRAGAKPAPQGRRLERLRSRHFGTACFVISARAAAWLLEETETVNLPIDRFLFDPASPVFHNLHIYQMSPAPVVQGGLATKVGARHAAGTADWAATSIIESGFVPGDLPEEVGSEGWPARLRRRLREEARALATGTRYVTVPFG